MVVGGGGRTESEIGMLDRPFFKEGTPIFLSFSFFFFFFFFFFLLCFPLVGKLATARCQVPLN